MRVALRRGRFEHQRASALVTSANDSLVGNLQPEYWRFEGGINVDGALRAQAGPDLIDACLALPIQEEGKRDLVRWDAGRQSTSQRSCAADGECGKDDGRVVGCGCHHPRRGP